MRFLILTQYFPPEIGGPQTRLQSMAIELIRAGHQVEVVTALPNYPEGKFLAGYKRSFYRQEERHGIQIQRLWLYPAMGRGLSQMLNYASFALTSLFGLLHAKRPDFIFVESPPLILSIPAIVIGRLRGVPVILNVVDLWPDAVIDGGFIAPGLLTRLLTAIELWSYRKVAYVNCVTEGIRETLIHAKSVPVEKILFLPNGVDTDLYQPSHSDADLARELGLAGKKIILWAGTLGCAHGLEHVLDAAKLLEGNQEIHFLFVGDGSAKAELVRRKNLMNLRNVTFHDPVSLEKMPPYYSIAAAGLASLLALPLHNGARPSKIFPIMASGKPLIFAGKGETAQLIQDARAGVVVKPGNPEELANAILWLTRSPERAQELGCHARQYVENNFRWSALVKCWLDRLGELDLRPRSTAGAQSTVAETTSPGEFEQCR
jgi:colanic acid biosynthesis glycosyl transferase WcaI